MSERTHEPKLSMPDPEPRKGPSILVLVTGGLALLLGSVALLRTCGRGNPPAPETVKAVDGYATSLKFGAITLSEAGHGTGGKSIYVDGTLTNTGQKTLNGLSVQVIFHADDASIAKLETVPLRLVRTKEPYVDLEPVSAEPLGPGQSHEFRLIFEDVPASWNTQPPEIHPTHTELK